MRKSKDASGGVRSQNRRTEVLVSEKGDAEIGCTEETAWRRNKRREKKEASKVRRLQVRRLTSARLDLV